MPRIKIDCPDIPDALSHGLPPPGSALWCAWIDELRDYCNVVGVALSKWIDSNFDPMLIRNEIGDYHNRLLPNAGVATRQWLFILEALVDILDQLIIGWNAFKEIVACAWSWHKIVLPQASPGAYLGALIIRNVLHTLQHSEIGPEWIAKATINLVIEIPALEDAISHLLLYLMPMEMPSASEATAAWLRGRIDNATRDCVWKYHGHNPIGYEPYILAQGGAMGFDQAIEAARRQGEGEGRTARYVRRAGYVDAEQIEALTLLYDRLQTEGQALQWTRSNVVTEEYARAYGLDAGFAESYWPRNREALRAQGVTRDIAALNYRQHWAQLGVGQMQEMLYRLRRDNPNVKTPFDETDYEAHLTASGYTPWQIERLQAIMHRPLSTGEAHDLFRRGLMRLDEVIQLHMATGVSPADASSLAQRDQQIGARWRAEHYAGWTPHSVGRAYAIGQISHNQVITLLQDQGIAPHDIAQLEQRARSDLQHEIIRRARARLLTSTASRVGQALKVGVMDTAQAVNALTKLGWPAAQANGIAAIEVAAAKVDRVKHALNHLRRAFHAGEIALPYVRDALQQLGVIPSAIASYIAMWEIENTPGRKRRSAKQIVADVSEGAITVEDAAMRLTNLGYTDVDTRLYLADAQRAMITTEAARMAAHSGNGHPLGAELARVAHAAQGLSRRVVAELKQQASPARLKSYFVGGLIDEESVRYRLELYGWLPSAIDLFVRDAIAAKEKKNAPKPSKSKPAAPSSAPAGSDTIGVGPAPTAVP
jgi:hypothetical protein